ncbi:hypothetical protein DFH08DRAFT_797040 [Mycena albidolilacea]|uniref:Uncharacterized protein n=1 Tax=Mycena albidolilacea TaxID=1033008 RepID=A0AAD7F407_9AGAR|nr:hypothetical protein DFH08DRAFT_797040 [Mycena albidolilacea]
MKSNLRRERPSSRRKQGVDRRGALVAATAVIPLPDRQPVAIGEPRAARRPRSLRPTSPRTSTGSRGAVRRCRETAAHALMRVRDRIFRENKHAVGMSFSWPCPGRYCQGYEGLLLNFDSIPLLIVPLPHWIRVWTNWVRWTSRFFLPSL